MKYRKSLMHAFQSGIFQSQLQYRFIAPVAASISIYCIGRNSVSIVVDLARICGRRLVRVCGRIH